MKIDKICIFVEVDGITGTLIINETQKGQILQFLPLIHDNNTLKVVKTDDFKFIEETRNEG